MRLVFAGTPVFAERALDALHRAGHDIALVLTRPDKPAQRGQKIVASPVKLWAQAQGIEVWQPPTLRDPQTWDRLRALRADVMVVAAYGLILPQAVLDIPRLGCLNIHASLLPRWRGAAPIQRAIQSGDRETGITIMQMEAGLDTGPMRRVDRLPIATDENAASLHDRLAELGAESIVKALVQLEQGSLPIESQPELGVTYAAKIVKADGVIDWTQPARVIVDQIRAFDPAPGCAAALQRLPDTLLKVWKARVSDHRAHPQDATPGTVIAVGDGVVTVCCGPAGDAHAVDLLELQRPGARRLPARDFLSGFALYAGDRLCTPQTGPA
jgi:methionyl-tRNA formyltransferase